MVSQLFFCIIVFARESNLKVHRAEGVDEYLIEENLENSQK